MNEIDMLYTLDENNNPTPCSLMEWGELFETEEGRKKKQIDFTEIDGYTISTVFLGIDHGFDLTKKPILFETMIFYRNESIYETQCATYDEAKKMHQDAIQWINDGCKDE